MSYQVCRTGPPIAARQGHVHRVDCAPSDLGRFVDSPLGSVALIGGVLAFGYWALRYGLKRPT